MVYRSDSEVGVGEEVEPVTEKGIALSRPMLTEAAIEAITYDLKMAEKLVATALEESVDYGQVPGVAGKGLWDPGASKIMNAFETYPRHKVLYHEETDTLITWAIEAEIIHRASGRIVGAGVGACSTREPKYKYRWISKGDTEKLGYTEPQIKQLKTRKGKRLTDDGKFFEVIEYRAENPEYGEQVNTILQMAAKRGETDAAKTLPGVSSVLRKLFTPEKKKGAGQKQEKKAIDEDSPRWTTFWNAAKDLLGDNYREKAHTIIGVSSMEEWLKKGKSLDDAIRVIAEKLAAKGAAAAAKETRPKGKKEPAETSEEAGKLDLDF